MNRQTEKYLDPKTIGRCNRILASITNLMPPVSIGSIDFVIKILHDVMGTEYKPSHKLHTHQWFELSIITRGALRYTTEGGEIVYREGDVFFMPPHTPHNWQPEEIPYVITGFQAGIRAQNSLADDFVEKLPAQIERRGFYYPDQKKLLETARTWQQEVFARKTLHTQKIPVLIHFFLLTFFQSHFGRQLRKIATANEPGDAHHAHTANLARAYIQEHMRNPITLDEVAMHCGFSPRHLNRIFKNVCQVSLGDFIIQEKMKTAARELQETSNLVKTVAYGLGYADVSYFCRVFKKTTGQTPEEYRVSI